jgi:hypothetical protein
VTEWPIPNEFCLSVLGAVVQRPGARLGPVHTQKLSPS